MRIESPRYTERFGSVRINDVQKVLELELGSGRTLAQADVEEVLRQIEERGYYLQMPPRTGVDIPVA